VTHSMTAFASRTGEAPGLSWTWEMRGVNARGLDLRLRLPEGMAEVDTALRKALASGLTRGNITVNLRVTRDEAETAPSLDLGQLDTVLKALDTIQERAFSLGVTLGQPTASDVLAYRGVLQSQTLSEDGQDLTRRLIADIPPLLQEFVAMRAQEGGALHELIAAQVDRIAALILKADAASQARAPKVAAALTAALQRVMQDVADADTDRVSQELALLAVKGDVTEEIDRLKAHVEAARALLQTDGPVGRKLDFLCQEFNREANTLCAKSQDVDLTAVGLDLKATIEQMREQIQNVE